MVRVARERSRISPRALILSVWGCLLLLAAAPAWATVYYVAPGGNDAAAGTDWGTALAGLQVALDKVDVTEVRIAGGTYALAATVNWTGHTNVTIRGGYEGVGSPGSDDPALWPTVVSRDTFFGDFRILDASALSGCALEQVTIADGNTPNDTGNTGVGSGGGVRIQNSSVDITDCIIRDNQCNGRTNGYIWGGGLYVNNSTVSVLGTLFSGNRAKCTPSTNNNRAHGGGMACVNSTVTVTDCEFDGNFADAQGHHGSFGGAFYATGGSVLVTDSTMTANEAGPNRVDRGSGGALAFFAGTTVENCTITDNIAWNADAAYGGGGVRVWGGELRNCLVADNRASWDGGGIYVTAGTVESVTVAGNRISEPGRVAGALLAGSPVVTDCIFAGNIREFDNADVSVSGSGGTVTYSCTVPGRTGTGNVGLAPEFVDPGASDYHLLPSSPAIDTATTLPWMAAAADLDGNARIRGGTPDMGCYEAAGANEGPFRVGFVADVLSGLDSLNVNFTATVAGANTTGVVYAWDFDNDGDFDAVGGGLATTPHAYGPGVHAVRLQVTNAISEVATQIRIGYIFVSASEIYVSSLGDGSNGLSWATAFNDVQTGLDFADHDNTIYVRGETFAVTQSVIWSGKTNVSIRGGYEGAVATVGPGPRDSGIWPTVVSRNAAGGNFRVMDVSNVAGSLLEQVTVADGNAPSSGSKQTGGGIRIQSSSLDLHDCVIRDNQANAVGNGYVWGGGVYLNSATVNILRTTFSGNRAKSTPSTNNNRAHGGGVAAENSTVTVVDCDFTGNFADAQGHHGSRGGAIYLLGGSGAITDTTMTGNESGPNRTNRGQGGAIWINSGTVVERCTITGNRAWGADNGYGGGGVYMAGGELRNSLVADNRASWDGGGIYATGGTMESVTVAGSRISEPGRVAGVFLSGTPVVTDCIFAANIREFDNDDVSVSSTGGTITYSCTIPGRTGTGNVGVDPEFVSTASSDYHLLPSSPAIDTAFELAWMAAATDLDGNARIRGTVPDMGCFEAPGPGEGPLSVGFTADVTSGLGSLTVTFTATAAGSNTAGLVYQWDFDNNGTFDLEGAAHQVAVNNYGPGLWSVRLRVTNAIAEEAILTQTDYISVSAAEIYVSTAGDDSDGLSWATAFHELQSGINFAGDGNTIYVRGETLVVAASVVWSGQTDVAIRGGYEGNVATVGPGPRDSNTWTTVVQRDAGAGNFRVMDASGLTGCVLEQVTIAAGNTPTSGIKEVGGGMRLQLSELDIVDCVVRDNQCNAVSNGYVWGGGIYAIDSTLSVVGTQFSGNVAKSTPSTNNNRAHGGGLAAENSAVTILDCTFTENLADAQGHHGSRGGAIYLVGGSGFVSDTTMTANESGPNRVNRGSGGAIWINAGTVVENCIVTDNIAWGADNGYGGGGVYMGGGELRNSLVADNRASWDGGGLYATGGTIESVTVAGNRISESGRVAGVLLAGSSVVTDCIFAANIREFDNAEVSVSSSGGTVTYSDTIPGRAGTGNVGLAPEFIAPGAGDYHLLPSSPAIDAAFELAWMAAATDLDGNSRVRGGTPDMGCYEAPAANEGPLTVGFVADVLAGLDTLNVVFTATVAGGNTAGLNYQWDFDNDGTFDATGGALATVPHTYGPGVHSVRLRVTNAGSEEAIQIRVDYIFVSASAIYVSSLGDGSDGLSWATAFNDIQSALNFAAHDNAIYLRGETFLTAQSLVWSGQSNVSLLGGYEGAVATVGPGPRGTATWPTVVQRDAGAGSFRVMDLSNLSGCLVEQVAITGGFTPTSGIKQVGGGMRVQDSTLEVRDCTISNNQANAVGNGYVWGGGVYASDSTLTVTGTRFSGNTAKSTPSSNNNRAHGGGLAAENSVVTVSNCSFVDNAADAQGHHGSRGGAIYLAGGTGTVRTTLMAGNRAGPNRALGLGGGIYVNAGTAVENCTIAANRVWHTGTTIDATAGGVYAVGGTVTNTVVYLNENVTQTAADDLYATDPSTVSFSLAPELTAGVNNNLSSDPLFADAGSGDYRLVDGSPAIDAGNNLPWMAAATDLDGEARIQAGTVDMGAFEGTPPPTCGDLEAEFEERLCGALSTPPLPVSDAGVLAIAQTVAEELVAESGAGPECVEYLVQLIVAQL